MIGAKGEPKPYVNYRIYRAAEDRWYTEKELRRKARVDKLKSWFKWRRAIS